MLSEPAGAPPRRAAVLGSPIAHSLSPVLHRTAYSALGLTGWRYDAHEVDAADLAGFLAGLGPEWAGLLLTMPLKEAALDLAADVSPLAARVGAANTLVRRPDGGWSADNTDVEGVRRALTGARPGALPRTAVLIGSGATARSVVAALAGLGVTDLTFVVRERARTETLAQCRAHGIPTRVCTYADAAPVLAAAPLVVSTVPAGAANPLAQRLADTPGWAQAAGAAPAALVLDVVYAGWPTAIAGAYERRGACVVGGLEMLVHQAVAQVRLMTGREPAVEPMRAAGLAALHR